MLRALSAITFFALCFTTGLSAQRVRFGFAYGTSLVGGGDSRVLVPTNGYNVTGADQSGHHIRLFADFPLSSPSVIFRAELFYNVLHSGPNSWAFVGNDVGKAALTDKTFGLTGSFVASLKPHARVSPYFLFGGGLFMSQLGTNSDPQSRQVAMTEGGMGLGLQTGFGLKIKTGKRDLLLEWRYGQALNNTRGSTFMPLTIGVRF
jgi:hypothetical protein